MNNEMMSNEQQNMESLKEEYAAFFREGGYRLMKLLVVKAEIEVDVEAEDLDVVGLMRLQNGVYTEQAYIRWRAADEICKINDIYDLDNALFVLLRGLPHNWGEVIDNKFGRCIKSRGNGTGIRKRTAENALAGTLRAIEKWCDEGNWWYGEYDFAAEGLPVVRKIMSFLKEAAAKGEDGSPTLLMKAVSSMKLFRNGKKGIIYNESLQEFCEKTGRPAEGYAGASGRNELIADMFIMQEAGTGQGLSGIESKVGEGRSSILIDWMYEIYSIMTAVRRYMPDKYERIMSFHWTKSEEKLKDLFLEVAAMIAAIENQNKAIC